MLQDNNKKNKEQKSDVEVNPAKPEQLKFEMAADQNLPMAILAGAVASMVAAAVWAVVTVVTGYKIGLVAVGVGIIVGYTVRAAGKGISSIYSVVGAILALIGCLAGNLLSVCGVLAVQEGVPIYYVLSQLNPQLIVNLMITTFSGMDLLFYGIAIYEGYRISVRKVSGDELARLAQPV